MKSPLRIRALLWTVAVVAAVPCHAFKLQPTAKQPDADSRRLGLGTLTGLIETPLVKVYVDQFSTPVHEDLTHRAYGCHDGHVRCRTGGAPSAVIEGVQWNDNPPFSYRTLKLTVSPTCMGVTIQLPNLHPTCWSSIFARAAATASTARGLAFGPRDTLLERSHFGDLQFIHAMAVDGEPPQVTRGNILAWARFAYLVSVGEIASGTVIADGTTVGSLASFFPGSGDSVLTLFTKGTEPHSDERVGDIAFGSLLHLVQDSFSRSHVSREKLRTLAGEALPGRIVQFHSYAHQDPYVHAKRDALEALEQNAEESNLLTAIGVRLVALRARKAPFDDVQRLLDSVFELSENAVRAGPGKEFEVRPAERDLSPGT
jgi:hypothetical protein